MRVVFRPSMRRPVALAWLRAVVIAHGLGLFSSSLQAATPAEDGDGEDSSPRHDDAPGGGGAGGTIVLQSSGGIGVQVFADGGDQLITNNESEGAGGGGGGGGGVIATTGDDRFRIPGADQTYAIGFANPGAAIDSNSVIITDTLPAEVELWTGAFSGVVSVPIDYSDGTGPAATGLTFCSAAQISYSEFASGNDFTYTPNGGYDPAVLRVRITPTGAVPEGYDDAKTFEIFLRARIK